MANNEVFGAMNLTMLHGLAGRTDPSMANEYRPLHIAELVANDLRRKIVSGAVADGATLPRQEDLLATYGVSKPSLREALRILESEGLISVRRGKIGGAVVHRPDFHNVAYSIGLVLESQGTPVPDLSTALNLLEPQCVALCAGREDRNREVIPRLRRLHEAAALAIGNMQEFTVLSRRFHEVMVSSCGNQSLILVVGALEAVWSAHAHEWAHRGGTAVNEMPDLAYREQGLADHAVLMDLIAKGAVDEARAEASRHLEWAPVYSLDETTGIVSWSTQMPSSRKSDSPLTA
jgi:DNA-binding FadR family transcriptional regulator